MAQKYSAQEVIDALYEVEGDNTAAAKLLGCTRQTVYNYRQKYVTVQEAHEDAKEQWLDHVEGKLREKINSGNVTSIIFALKTQGKHRGWVERQEYAGPDGGQIEIKVVREHKDGKPQP